MGFLRAYLEQAKDDVASEELLKEELLAEKLFKRHKPHGYSCKRSTGFFRSNHVKQTPPSRTLKPQQKSHSQQFLRYCISTSFQPILIDR